jgi:ATP-dependent DNA helicase DinG
MLDILKKECTKLGYTPHKVQIEAVEWLNNVWESPNKCKVLSSPVGSGKSLIAKAITEYNDLNGLKTAIITPQNLLVDQYIVEFPELNYLKGKEHYTCNLSKTTCNEGKELQRVLKEKCLNCPYEDAKQRTYSENTTIFNSMSYYALPKVSTLFDYQEIEYDIDTIIVDEFQSLPAMLRSIITIKLWANDIEWEKGISSSIPNIIILLQKYSQKLLKYIFNSNTELGDRLKYSKLQKHVDYIAKQLTLNSQYFICEEIVEKLRGIPTNALIIRPKYVPAAISSSFFKIAKRVILMSGTAFTNIWEELGFNEVDYIDLPSPIPVERRQIFVTNSININSKLDKLERWDMLQSLATQIKFIVNEIHMNENGVILLPYNLAEEIKPLLSESYFIHMDKNTKKEKIEKFKAGLIYGVGVFSGSYEGLSLNDDISRFTIIPKVPYPNLMDNVVKIRMKERPIDYSLETISTIIQASGRSTRSERDYSFTYILDSNFTSLYPRVKKYIPKYFREALNFGLPTQYHKNLLNEFRKERLKCA